MGPGLQNAMTSLEERTSAEAEGCRIERSLMDCVAPPSTIHQCPRADSWLLRGVFVSHGPSDELRLRRRRTVPRCPWNLRALRSVFFSTSSPLLLRLFFACSTLVLHFSSTSVDADECCRCARGISLTLRLRPRPRLLAHFVYTYACVIPGACVDMTCFDDVVQMAAMASDGYNVNRIFMDE